MRRKVLIVFATVATVLVTLGFAKRPEAKDRADQIVNRDEICSQAKATVGRYLRLYLRQTNNKAKLKHAGTECKVTRLGRDEYEVQSSFLVANNPTPVHYTVVGRITIDKIIYKNENILEVRGGWSKIKFHGFHKEFVPLTAFDLDRNKRRYPRCADIQKGNRRRLSRCYP